MTSSTRPLRLIQTVCVILVITCIVVVYLAASGKKGPASVETQSVIVALGAWSAVGVSVVVEGLLCGNWEAPILLAIYFLRWECCSYKSGAPA